MHAQQLKTIADLLNSDDERVELINGEIVKRPMAGFEHAFIQSGLSDEMVPLKRTQGPGGWWIVTEISVKYNDHQCPCHDIAGWRKERLPQRPSGIVEPPPDWVCEITSPGHERKDLFHHFMMLQRNQIPFYWVVSPEDKTLIAYQHVDEHYRVVFSMEVGEGMEGREVRIPPFAEIEIDLSYLFGYEDNSEVESS